MKCTTKGSVNRGHLWFMCVKQVSHTWTDTFLCDWSCTARVAFTIISCAFFSVTGNYSKPFLMTVYYFIMSFFYDFSSPLSYFPVGKPNVGVVHLQIRSEGAQKCLPPNPFLILYWASGWAKESSMIFENEVRKKRFPWDLKNIYLCIYLFGIYLFICLTVWLMV